MLPHAVVGCRAGACAIGQCDVDFADCNKQVSDGCEVNLRENNSNCGACGQVCPVGSICAGGTCTVGCSPPFTNCGGTCANLATSVGNCGQCGAACSDWDFTGNTSLSCVAGSCVDTVASCPAGQTACQAPFGSGKLSCHDTMTDPANCGACGVACASVNSVAACVNGHCALCPPGLLTCSGAPPSAGVVFCADPNRSNRACGGCGVATCSAGQSCWGGVCVATSSLALVTGVTVDDMQVDNTSIYFVSSAAGTVNAVAKTGGIPRVLASGQAKPLHLAVDGQYVYFSASLGGAIMRIPISGGRASVLVAAVQPTELLVDSQNVYWIGDGAVNMVPKGGGTASVLVAQGVDRDSIFVQNTSSLFWARVGMASQLPKTGGTPTILLPQSNSYLGVFDVDDTYAYSWLPDFFAADSAAKFMATPLPGVAGSAIPLWTLPWIPVSPLVHDGTQLFFFAQNAGTSTQQALVKISTCQNTIATTLLDGLVLAGPVPPNALTTDMRSGLLSSDQDYVYWSDGTMIGRVAK
jgi:hypothetical protein